VLRPRAESGQALVLTAIVMLVLLGFLGLVIDVGRAYQAQRILQSQADAAALAGAQELPDPSTAIAVAEQYGGESGAVNENGSIGDVQTTATTKCLTSAPGCTPSNAVVVTQATQVDTYFASLFGLDSFDVDVKATACSPCGTKPLDIMLVLDRTGSMCQFTNGQYDPACTDLENAREGMKTFLGFFDPTIDWVGLAVLPPATSLSNKCVPGNYNSASSKYLIVPLSDDYKLGGSLNPASDLVATIECQQGAGSTAYAHALEAAQQELVASGRPEADDIIVFLSDGAANTGPNFLPATSPYRTKPCGQGVASAGTAKGQGTLIFSIGYDVNEVAGSNVCRNGVTGALELPPISAEQALQQIATDSTTYYNKPNPGQLNTIFTSIAADISAGRARLVDDNKL
jgi:type II secretory pathway pseudopilin PulG